VGAIAPTLDDQYGFSSNKTFSDRTSIYDKNLNERHSVTLGKHLNLFSAGALPWTLLEELTTLPLSVGRGKPLPIRQPLDSFGILAFRLWRLEPRHLWHLVLLIAVISKNIPVTYVDFI